MWRGHSCPRNLFAALRLANNLVRYRAWHFFVARKVHRVLGAALRARTHVRRVTKHFCQRNDGLDHLRTSPVFHAFNASATRTQVAHDGAGKVFRRDHFHRHHRLEQYWRGFTRSFFERHRSRDLERHFVRINIVITAIVERDFHVHDRVASHHSTFERFLNSLVNRLDVLLGDGAANDVIDELVALAWLLRVEINFHVPVLSAAASLANVFRSEEHTSELQSRRDL